MKPLSINPNSLLSGLKPAIKNALNAARNHAAALALCAPAAVSQAGELNLANNALELSLGVEPNVMLLSDNSGSMDYTILIEDTTEGVFNNQPKASLGLINNLKQASSYYYTYRGPAYSDAKFISNGFETNSLVVAPSADFLTVIGVAPFGVSPYPYAPTEQALQTAGVATPWLGIWRLWFSGYNRLHYDPNTTYVPWSGLDSKGKRYTSVSATKALYNPYQPDDGELNLTVAYSYTTACGFDACRKVNKDRGKVVGGTGEDKDKGKILTNIAVNNFFPARYYTWTDTNSNGIVDASDGHSLVEIKPATGTYQRTKFSDATGRGRFDCGTDNKDGTVTCSYAEEIQNFANWFSYYRKRDLVSKSSLSSVISKANSARIGYAVLNEGYHNIKTGNKPGGTAIYTPVTVDTRVASMNLSPERGNKKTLLDAIFNTPPGGPTETQTEFEKIGNYYECKANNTFNNTASAPGNANCPVEAAPKGNCQSNYALIITDGFYRANFSGFGNKDGPGAGDTEFDGGAFADNFSDTLADIAMHFYERDLHLTLADQVPVNAREIALYNGPAAKKPSATDSLHQRMLTYSIGFGVKGTINAMPASPSTAFAWPDPTNPVTTGVSAVTRDDYKIDDLRHAAYNGRGEFISARDPIRFRAALEKIFSQFLGGTDAASAVTFNSQTLRSDSLVFRAFFDPSKNSGDLVAQKIDKDGNLNKDSAGKPVYEWRAAEKLDRLISRAGDTRTIITYQDDGNKSKGVDFKWASLSAAQQALLNDPQPADITTPVGENRLGYLRGHSQHEGLRGSRGEFRPRKPALGKLGDIVHSTPVFVGAPEYTGRGSGEYPGEFPANTADLYRTFKADNKDRAGIVYVGANDGMLHAFKAASGEELFAYVPNLVFKNLSRLTDPDYTHRFYVNQTPSINDVFMARKGASSRTWNSILISGLGAGGKGYFALNITDPSRFNSAASAVNNVMWEFTENDDGAAGNSDLGYSLSEPLIAMSNAEYSNGDNKWVAIFGNGYNSTSADGDAALYILFPEQGQDGIWTAGSDYIKISTGQGKAESADKTTPNGIGGVRGIDIDGNGTVDRVYAGDLQGNLYRFDLSDSNANNWNNTANRKIIFKARYSSSFPRSTTATVQPITRRPVVIRHPERPGHIVIVATGSWMTREDANSKGIQSIYGIWDDDSGDLVTMQGAGDQLVKQSFTNHSTPVHNFTVRTLSNNAVAWNNTGTNKVKGWYIDFAVPVAGAGESGKIEFPGERAVRNLQLRGDFLLVNSVIPRSLNSCSAGAGGFELAFNPVTGGSGSRTVFDLNADGTFDANDNVGSAAGDANIVTGTRFNNSTPTDSAFIEKYRITQGSDKESRRSGVNLDDSSRVGRNSWRELTLQ